MQGFAINQDGKFMIYSGFDNGKAILTVENEKDFKNVKYIDVYDIFNFNKNCPLQPPPKSLNRLHEKHINNYLKGIKQNG